MPSTERTLRLNKWNKRLLIAAIFIILSNMQPLNSILVMFVRPFFMLAQYATPSGGFRDDEMPLMARHYDGIERRFNHYKQDHPSDSVLYRLYRKNPLLFFEWRDMIFSPKYQLQYLNSAAIKKDAESKNSL